MTRRLQELFSPGVRVVDSHLHLWDPSLLRYDWLSGGLNQRFGPDELAATLREVPSIRPSFVFVQADCSTDQALDEVRWVASVAGTAGIRGVVGFAALELGDAVRGHLDALRREALVVGVRRLLPSEPPGFATSSGFLAGARLVAEAGLTFDACVRASQLVDVIALADAVPQLRIVLDHLGKPEVGTAESPIPPTATRWLDDFCALADRPNVATKLSGLPAQAPDGLWSPEQLSPFVDVALEAFGAGRVLFGSDWPVSTSYAEWLGFVIEHVRSAVGDDGLALVMARNAEAFYSLRKIDT